VDLNAQEATLEQCLRVAFMEIENAIDELDSSAPDLGHIRFYLSSAIIWLGPVINGD
jgi:hypothetical protein